MEMTTATTGKALHHRVNCSNSTVADDVTIIVGDRLEKNEVCVLATYKNGATWGYFVPLADYLLLGGEKSVGRFINGVKRVATFSWRCP